MARGIIRKPSFWKIVGAFRSQWKRTLSRIFIPGYGRRGMGWFRDPKRALYNWWYNKTSISLRGASGHKSSTGVILFAISVAFFVNLFAFPLDLVGCGAKSGRRKRAIRTWSSANGGNSGLKKKSRAATSKAKHSGERARAAAAADVSDNGRAAEKAKRCDECREVKTERSSAPTEKDAVSSTYEYKFELPPDRPQAQSAAVNEVEEPDESTPKSKPKNENDRYIRKRMIVAGSSYCDKTVLASLDIGSYFDVEAEPDNTHDKDAVVLRYNGAKIGYVSMGDRMAFAVALGINRRIYGVITAIKDDEYPTKYEFETWFDSSRQ